MRHKILKTIAIICLTHGLTGLHAQNNINSTGGNASGNGGSVSYSVGQTVYQTHTTTSGAIMEGIQQPYEITSVTSCEETIDINLSVSAYPNPASDYLILSIEEFENSEFFYQLYNINGKLLQNGKITNDKTVIAMDSYGPSTYIMKIFSGNDKVKMFKIIKK